MKSSWVGLGMCALLAGYSSAAMAAEIKIGAISLNQVFQEYQKVIDSNTALEKEKQQVKTMISEMQDLEKTMEHLNDQGKEERRRQLKAKQEDLQRRTTEVRKNEDRILREILKDVEQVSAELRKKEKFTLIIDDRLVISGQEDLDVTKKVIDGLNAAYKNQPAAKSK
ncbi:MAG: OmpH family outer membrane protein [Candidatus Omnitrophica bacterium]|nr:OmpH family outer membrane protein [Candidatus Omnitrophota bacterium]